MREGTQTAGGGTEDCGVILSPRSPGLVEPSLYFWLVEHVNWHYYEILLYYVQGPNIKQDDCSQHFKCKYK